MVSGAEKPQAHVLAGQSRGGRVDRRKDERLTTLLRPNADHVDPPRAEGANRDVAVSRPPPCAVSARPSDTIRTDGGADRARIDGQRHDAGRLEPLGEDAREQGHRRLAVHVELQRVRDGVALALAQRAEVGLVVEVVGPDGVGAEQGD